MISASSDFINKINSPSRHFVLRLTNTLNNEEIALDYKSATITKGSCGGSSLAIGCAFSAFMEVTAEFADIALESVEVKAELGLLLDDDSYEYVPIGYFTIQKPTRQVDQMTFQMVDRMLSKLNAAYSTDLTYPTTISAVVAELQTKTGVTISLLPDIGSQSMMVKPTVATCRDAVQMIATLALGFAYVNANGVVVIDTFKRADADIVDVDYDYVKEHPQMDEKQSVVEGISVQVSNDSVDESGDPVSGTVYTYGSGNMLSTTCVYMSDTIFEAVKNNIVGFQYNGGSVKFMGNPLIEPSDKIRFTVAESDDPETEDDESLIDAVQYVVPAMEIVHTFDGGLTTQITAPGSFEFTESTNTPGVFQQFMEAQAAENETTKANIGYAREAAAAAQQTANNARTLATGKNKIFYQNSAPTSGMSVGDLWFNTGSGNAIYEYKSTGWVLRQLAQGAIAANSITANEINVATLSAIAANVGVITAGVLKSSDYESPASGSPYSTAGMLVDLNNKVIRMPNTAILSNGVFYTKSGKIGGWSIGEYSIYRTVEVGTKKFTPTLYAPATIDPSANAAFHIEVNDNGTITHPFVVYYDGTFRATNGDITGKITATSGSLASLLISGYITTSSARTTYNQAVAGLTLDQNGIGGWGSTTQYWNMTKGGKLTAANATVTSGTLGSWTLTERYLYATRTVDGVSRTTGLQVPDQGVYALAIGATNFNSWASAPFRVTHSGDLTLGSALNLVNTSLTDASFISFSTVNVERASISFQSNDFSIESYKYLDLIGRGTVAISCLDSSGSDKSSIWLSSDGSIAIYGKVITDSGVVAGGGVGTNGRDSYNSTKYGMWATTGGSIALRHDGSSGAGIIGWFYGSESSWSSQILQSASGVLEAVGYFKMRTTGGTTRRVAIGTASDAAASAGQHISHMWCGSGNVYFSAEWGTADSYATRSITVSSSDIRLKENVKDSGVNALNVLNEIRIREFDWKDGRHQIIGMVADEIEKIDPRLSVGGGKDADGNICYKSVDTFYLEGYLVKGVQELYKTVQELRKELNELKGTA